MARKRMLDPNIWQSEDFSKLSVFSRLLFIGLFSNADDEGKGRANPVYLKSIVFPFDEGVRVTDIIKSISEISATMSCTFYEVDGKQYYVLNNWSKWQRVEKPQASSIPNPSNDNDLDTFGEQSGNVRGMVGEQSPNNRGTIPPNRKEENKNKNKNKKGIENNIPPMFDETSNEYRLSKLLIDLILQNNPKAKVPQDIKKWAEHIEKMIRLDSYSAEEIEKIIRYSQKDNFWKSNILSTEKLREKAGTLILRMNSKNQESEKPKSGFDNLKKKLNNIVGGGSMLGN